MQKFSIFGSGKAKLADLDTDKVMMDFKEKIKAKVDATILTDQKNKMMKEWSNITITDYVECHEDFYDLAFFGFYKNDDEKLELTKSEEY